VQANGLVSRNVARIGLADNASAGALDKVAKEMDAAAAALFTKKAKPMPPATGADFRCQRGAYASRSLRRMPGCAASGETARLFNEVPAGAAARALRSREPQTPESC
jgi:hypothetical protein